MYVPLSNLSMRDIVKFLRHVHDWGLDMDMNTEIQSVNRREPPPKPKKPEGYDAFVAEIEALLAEEDDTDLPPEDQLPKAAPTG